MLTGRSRWTLVVVTLPQTLLDKIITSFGSSLLRGDVEEREVSSGGEEGDSDDEEAGASC